MIVSPGDQQAIKAIKRVAIRVSTAPPRLAQPEPAPASPAARSATAPEVTASPKRTKPTPKPSIPTFTFKVITVDAQGRQVSQQQRQAQYFIEDLGKGVTLEMVSIPGGTFRMGSPAGEGDDDERPQHDVTVKPFLMGKYPITQAQWRTVAAFSKINRDLDPDPSGFKDNNRPVEKVSWYDAVEFCARLAKHTGHDYRLPSEAEWEYACRAGTTTPFHFGETITTGLANFNGNDTYASAPKGEYRQQTTDVGSFPPNAFGLYDLHGNVREWCLDHWHDNYQGAPSDGSAGVAGGNSERRLLRGGSWYLIPWACRSADRNRNFPDYRDFNIGFRVVCGSSWTL